ncbi:hypothetical protein WE348_20640 (plasmid) [Alteromonas macleodii]|uniref:hypothetical protein n=1 Tax=Alteromonas macleodii TaxID=28108 RepID=UPI0030D05686
MKLKAAALSIGLALGTLPTFALSQETGNQEETSCDMGQLHEEMMDRFKLPEIPSSLEDCGIGGFLNFDFSFGLGDFDFSSLFCNFAQDVIGNFKEQMSVDFNIGMNGIEINSPIYSLKTKGADEAVNELLYGATGVDQNGDGILGNVSDAYRDTLSSVRREFSNDRQENARATASIQDFGNRVRDTSSVRLEDVRRNIDAIQDVQTTGNQNTQPGNTRFNNGKGGVDTIGGDVSYGSRDLRLTPTQLERFSEIPYQQLQRMDEKEIEQYLRISEEQRRESYGEDTSPQQNRNLGNPYSNRDIGQISAPSTGTPRVNPEKNEPITPEPIYEAKPVDDPKKSLTELLFNRDK